MRPKKRVTLTLTHDEIAVITYLLDGATSAYAPDPFKDTYEMEDDCPANERDAANSAWRKVLAAWQSVVVGDWNRRAKK